LVAASIAVLSLSFSAHGEDKLMPPPYLLTGFDAITTGVTWDEAAVKRVLPPGVTPVKEMTGGINIYTAADGYNVGPYSASYLWVDIEGFDAPDGTKGRWMLAGVYGPSERAKGQFERFMGLPIRTGSARHQAVAGGVRASASQGGQDLVQVEVKTDASKCAPGGGTVTFLTDMPDGKMMLIKPVFWGEVCPAEVVSAKFTAPDGDPFAQFPIKKVNWTVQFRGSVAAPTLVAKP
jgi:hypothetical protein